MTVERINFNGDILFCVQLENVHKLCPGLCATHEYTVYFKVDGTDVLLMSVTECAHGEWWDWDVDSLDKHSQSIVSYAKQQILNCKK